MKVIVSHTSPDFDALASIALARLLYPGAVAVLLGSVATEVRAFIHLHRDVLELRRVSELDLEQVRELVVVDTSDPRRIAPFDSLVNRVPITIYDHHPRAPGALPAVRGIQRQVGATVTLLTLLLERKHIPIPPEIASLALLGIHEDTGNLSYTLTCAEDHEAAAHLLRSGASLSYLQDFHQVGYGQEQRLLLRRLLEVAREQSVSDYRVVVASLEHQPYTWGLAPLCRQLLELYDSDAALLFVRMEQKTLVVARAKADTFSLGQVLAQTLGGGGHDSAAFASSEQSLAAAEALVLDALRHHHRQPLSAKDLMSTSVRSIDAGASLQQAQNLLRRYGYNGLPVTQELQQSDAVHSQDSAQDSAQDKAVQVVGVISRRDLEKALHHGLGHSRVDAFMTKPPVTATEDTPRSSLEQLIQHHNIGRIPILRQGRLVGIVTRSDLIDMRHQQQQTRDLAQQLLSRLPDAAIQALEQLKTLLPKGAALYVVGGTVRDALLETGMQDLDLVLEGVAATSIAAQLQRQLGGEMRSHMDFGTATLILKNGLEIDLATAREEYYPYPGALPRVSPSNVSKDLYRRDFSINTLALQLWPEPPCLHDPFGGLHDLEHKQLRSLHPLSFIEDPTRIIRGARLAGRLGMHFHPDTAKQIPAALAPELLQNLSKSRLRNELMLTLAELRVMPALALLEHYGVLQAMFGLMYNLRLLQNLDAQRAAHPIPDESYLLALLLGLSAALRDDVVQSFHWPKRYAASCAFLAELEPETNPPASLRSMSLSEAEQALLYALKPQWQLPQDGADDVPQRRKLRGKDVIDLGVATGPRIGEILAAVAQARAEGLLESFEAELAMAKQLSEQ